MSPKRPLNPSLLLPWVAALMLTGCYRPQVSAEETIALQHPSTGTLESHALYGEDSDTRREWFSLTKVTNDEVCVDAGIVLVGPMDEFLLADVADYMKAEAAMLFFRDSGSRKRVEITERMAPAIVDQREGSWTGRREVETGNRETICTEQRYDLYGHPTGCVRFVERAETNQVAVPRTGTLYTAMAGRRWCIENDGFIRPESELFDINYNHVPHRFVLRGGAPREGAWGATGGIPAVGDAAIRAAVAARDATSAQQRPSRPPPAAPPPDASSNVHLQEPRPSEYETGIPACDSFQRTVLACVRERPDAERKRVYRSMVKGARDYRELARDPKKRQTAAQSCARQEQQSRKRCP